MKGGALPGEIDLQPQVLDLVLYAGDGVSFRLICTDVSGAPVDVTGGVRAQIRLNRVSQDVPLVSFTAGMTDAYQGIVVLSLTGAQTQALISSTGDASGKFTGVWDVEWKPAGAEARTLCQGDVECIADVTR